MDKKTKIFICKGYTSFKKALVDRGWHENQDANSPVFHLKFTIKRDSIFKPNQNQGNSHADAYNNKNNAGLTTAFQSNTLHDFQLVNHFQNNSLLATKVGLCSSLKNLQWWVEEHMDSFFPKCFAISKQQGDKNSLINNDLEEFTEAYRFVFSCSILKKYVDVAKEDIDKYAYQIPKILVSLNICEKLLLTIDEQIS